MLVREQAPRPGRRRDGLRYPAADPFRVRVILGFPLILWSESDILLPLANKWIRFVWIEE